MFRYFGFEWYLIQFDNICFQEAILRSLGEYTAKMPDFQKTENMTLILSKVPFDSNTNSQVDTDVQHVFMKALYMVAEKQTRFERQCYGLVNLFGWQIIIDNYITS
jgi:hypothetical protein